MTAIMYFKRWTENILLANCVGWLTTLMTDIEAEPVKHNYFADISLTI